MQSALEWVLSGRIFDADEALRHGLVRSLHPANEVVDVALALAREISENTAPVSASLASGDVADARCPASDDGP